MSNCLLMSEENLSVNELEKLLENSTATSEPRADSPTSGGSGSSSAGFQSSNSKNFKFIEDVSIKLTVELGRRIMPIREILKLTEGSLIELDKKIGDNLDLLANGKKVGEIKLITVNEYYGFQITKILDPEKLAAI